MRRAPGPRRPVQRVDGIDRKTSLRAIAETNEREAIQNECRIRIQAIEQRLRQRELELGEAPRASDIAIRRHELALKKYTLRRDKWTNPLTVGVMVAAFGLIGNFLNGLWTNLNPPRRSPITARSWSALRRTRGKACPKGRPKPGKALPLSFVPWSFTTLLRPTRRICSAGNCPRKKC